MLYFLRRPVAAVGERLDEDGRATRTVGLVGNGFERRRIGRNAFCDRALDGVFWHVRFLRGLDDGAKPGQAGISSRFLALYCDAPPEFAPEIALGRISRALLSFYLRPFVVTGHWVS